MAKYDIIDWPCCTLRPQVVSTNLSPFSRSGGRSIGGLEPAIRTDLGWWEITYSNVVLRNNRKESIRAWRAIRQFLSGRSGLVSVCVSPQLAAPYANDSFDERLGVPHSDGSSFSDGTFYSQHSISVISVGDTPIGATSIKFRVIQGGQDFSGVLFSYDNALYETGPYISIDGDVWEVPISPTVRDFIPDGSDLNFQSPRCLCRLSSDRGMDFDFDRVTRSSYPIVSFVEATDYWNQKALGLI